MIFLIHYNSAKSELVSIKRFSDGEFDKAAAARLELELQIPSGLTNHEIVLLEAVDEDQIRQTHGRYFGEVTTARH